MKDVLDLHTHTVASGHAYNTLYEMAQAANGRGLSLLGSSDHGPKMPGASHPFYFINFKAIPRTIHGVHILMGCEMNIMDYEGKVDLEDRFCRELDYALASLHEPCYQSGTVSQNTSAYVHAIQNPRIQIIGHPDDGRFPYDFDTVAAAAAEHHTLLEVNSSSLDPRSSRLSARENYEKLLACCLRHRAHIIINSDAHVADAVGDHRLAWELIEEMRFPEELIVNGSLEKLGEFIPKTVEYMTVH